MILESLVTTVDSSGVLNVAPMGPKVEPGDVLLDRFVLRPFQTSTTYRNLKHIGSGILHVTDDVLLMARAAIGLDVNPRTIPADRVRGRILSEACRYYEFVVDMLDDREARTSIRCRTLTRGRLRDPFGFNRAKHAVLEAAILATRLHLIPHSEISQQFEALAVPIAKTGGPAELEAFGLLRDHLAQAVAEGRALGSDSPGTPG